MPNSLRARVNKLAHKGELSRVDADRIRDALEKQIPKTPLIINRNGRTIPFCPICGGLLIKCADEDYREILDDDWRYMNYCDSCGQRIDYGEVE